jgi:AcrR family transcriptional regulator
MEKPEVDISTEEKIKQAAREVFHHKGYAATRTRDIAEAAGLNLALLNYYFRSKEKLFQLIMLETLEQFAASLSGVFNDPQTSFHEKVELVVHRYIDMLLVEPEVPLFILSELRNHPDALLSKLPIKELIMRSVFARQYEEEILSGNMTPLPLIQFIMNIMGLTVFPFIANPMMKHIGDLRDTEFRALMLERKKMIPVWIKALNTPSK